ncbi:MAG: flagellar protein FlgN [Pseudomonadota bacterium]
MNNPQQALEHLLTQELATLAVLKAILDEESSALLADNAESLEQITERKNNAIAAHAAQQTQRVQWMASAGIPSNAGLTDAVAIAGSTPRLESLRADLTSLAEECAGLNRHNGGLIRRLQERTQGALNILRGNENHGDVYSLSGAKAPQGGSRTLGKA